MTLQETLQRLESLGNEAVRKHNTKYGCGKKQYGVKHGDIRALAKKTKGDEDLVKELWKTGNADAQLLAVLLMKPKELTVKEIERRVRSVAFAHVADWLYSYVVSKHEGTEALREEWMDSGDPWAARAGWQLTAGRIAKNAEGLDLAALLERIEAEMAGAEPEVQWTMNAALANIGIHAPKLRKRAIAIGEKLGIYRDFPVSKGCTSPFAPIWIDFMVKRQG
jgi:3-methyladenine DNA glycosylase AlkD